MHVSSFFHYHLRVCFISFIMLREEALFSLVLHADWAASIALGSLIAKARAQSSSYTYKTAQPWAGLVGRWSYCAALLHALLAALL